MDEKTMTGSNGGTRTEEVKNRARGAAEKAGHRFDDTTSRLGRSVSTAAERLSHRSDGLSRRLASAGSYLQEHDAQGMGQDLTQTIRNHPIPALAIGAGLGFLIGRILAR